MATDFPEIVEADINPLLVQKEEKESSQSMHDLL